MLSIRLTVARASSGGAADGRPLNTEAFPTHGDEVVEVAGNRGHRTIRRADPEMPNRRWTARKNRQLDIAGYAELALD